MCKKDSGSKQKEQSHFEDKSHLARLEFVGKVILMYLAVKLNMFLGRLLWTDDQIPLRDGNELTSMLEKKEPWDTNMFESLFFMLISE